jgi:H+-transporting ATPase
VTSARIEASDGFARVFPEHKYAIVKALQERGRIVGMTGDGVNDAPALKQADIGIAVSGATDAARAAAALILTAPGLSTIIKGIEEARRIFERMTGYTLYRIAMTLAIMVFVVLATIACGFFPLTPVMNVMLALLDDVTIMTIAFDNAAVPPRPVGWQIDRVLLISSVLGGLAVAESFGLPYIGHTRLHLVYPQLQTFLSCSSSAAAICFNSSPASRHRSGVRHIPAPTCSWRSSTPRWSRPCSAASESWCPPCPGPPRPGVGLQPCLDARAGDG